MNASHKIDLLVMQDFQEMEGHNALVEGERVPDALKYLDQFLMVLLAIFTTGLIFVRQSKQGVATIYID